MTRLRLIMFISFLLVAFAGCGKIPLISPNRKDFPPWEKVPEGKGVSYLEKFTCDPGIDPIYLAKMRYDDHAALQLVIDAFGLVPRDDINDVSSFGELLGDEKPDGSHLMVLRTSTFIHRATMNSNMFPICGLTPPKRS